MNKYIPLCICTNNEYNSNKDITGKGVTEVFLNRIMENEVIQILNGIKIIKNATNIKVFPVLSV
jgi:hypothetical protein